MRYLRFLTAVIAASMVLSAGAQNQLKDLRVTNITPELSVYPCGDRHEALVVLHCQEPFDLVLSSNYDANLDLSVTTEGPEKLYSTSSSSNISCFRCLPARPSNSYP